MGGGNSKWGEKGKWTRMTKKKKWLFTRKQKIFEKKVKIKK